MVMDDDCYDNWQWSNEMKLHNYWEPKFQERQSDRTCAERIWIDKVAVDDGLVTRCTNVIKEVRSRIEHCGFVGKLMEEWASWLGCVARETNGKGQSSRFNGWWNMTIWEGVHCLIKVHSLVCITCYFWIHESARMRYSMHQRRHLHKLSWDIWEISMTLTGRQDNIC